MNHPKVREAPVVGTEPPYQNRQERQVGGLLDRYGIPFFYQSPMLVMKGDRHEIWYPTFTLPQYGMSVIDYRALQDDIAGRIAAYRYNQIPATVLGPRDLDQPNWQQALYHRLRQEVLQIPKYSLDRIVSLGTMHVGPPKYQIQRH